MKTWGGRLVLVLVLVLAGAGCACVGNEALLSELRDDHPVVLHPEPAEAREEQVASRQEVGGDR